MWEQRVEANAGLENAALVALRFGQLLKAFVVQFYDVVNRRRGHGLGVLVECFIKGLVTLHAISGGPPPAFAFGSLGKADCHFTGELEQSIEVQRRGVLGSRHGGEELVDIKRRAPEALGRLRDGSRQPGVYLGPRLRRSVSCPPAPVTQNESIVMMTVQKSAAR